MFYLSYLIRYRLLLPYERWKKGDEIKPVGKKRKKRKLVKPLPKKENENKTLMSETEKTETEANENKMKGESKDELNNVKVKTENVRVKSEEIGRKEEVQNKALIIKQELENMKIRKVST